MTDTNSGHLSTSVSCGSSPLEQQRLPRYTSYPPATEFGPLAEATLEHWLAHLPEKKSVSLYVHIPYCRQLCWFCGCFTSITHHYSTIRRYLDLLVREIAVTARHTGRLNAGHVHFGGGSPTILLGDDFTALMNTLGREYRLLPKAGISVEIDPRTVNRKKIAAYARAGVNRVSLGVQDFNPRVQEAVNRVQPFEQVEKVVEDLRAEGIDHINLDLMYGLPYQTPESLRETARQAVELEPDRLAVFGYAHVPWMRKHQKVLSDKPLAGARDRLALFDAIREVLTENDYTAVGIDHFARPGDAMLKALEKRTLRRNFQGYTTDRAETLLGFGTSAISSLTRGYAQNTSRLRDYEAAVLNDRLPVHRGVSINREDRLRREIITELMCYYDVDPVALAAKYKVPIDFQTEFAALKPLQETGVVCVEKNRVKVTDSGRPYVRAVCAVFDRYLGQDTERFSLAV